MKQTITVRANFSDLSRNIQICHVYQSTDCLLVISKIVKTQNNGEAFNQSKDSVEVETDKDYPLPIKEFAVSDNSASTLKQIEAAKELKFERPIDKYKRMLFAKLQTPSDEKDAPSVSLSFTD